MWSCWPALRDSYSSVVNSDRSHSVTPLALVLTGSLLLQSLAPKTARRPVPAEGLGALAGQGIGLAVLGGFGAAAADGLWLKANLAWERRDLVATDALVRAAIAADPRTEYFRINGARMIAFDLAEWRIPADAPAAVAAEIRREHAQQAVDLLEEGVRRNGPTPHLWIEMARVTHQRLAAPGRAAELYRRAAELPGAPYFAGRLHVELLAAEGRIGEARDWLRQWLPKLPRDDEAAQRTRMEARLVELERR